MIKGEGPREHGNGIIPAGTYYAKRIIWTEPGKEP